MDANSLKKHTTTRGFTYQYYYTAGQPGKPTLVFLHGFPSTSNDWRKVVPSLQVAGYGLVVPDMLGYAGTDKPVEPEHYVTPALSKDIIDILDAESVQKSILIGHDWGSRVVSRLADLYSDRFIAYAFLAAGYLPPQKEPLDPPKLSALYKKATGRDAFGYWEFFLAEDAASLIEAHPDSFYNLFFPNPPSLWEEHISPPGATRKWIETDQRSALPSYVTKQDKQDLLKTLLAGGLTAPLNWYKVLMTNPEFSDNQSNSEDTETTTKPVLFIGCLKDDVCIPTMQKERLKEWAKGPLTIRDYNADHWVILSHGDELSRDLLSWIAEITRGGFASL
ncbi:alpha/beta-hydrolase [Gloeopeniophorella convolvens]|nr:alpha/beta-hydrolase [Gloeopeniophorella convolvens]